MADKPRLPAVFNFLSTLIVFGAACGLGWMAWRYYEYSPWTRDGRVRVYTVQVAPEVSGTVVGLPVADNQFVHKGDLLFQIDPGTFRNALTQAEGALAEAKARAAYLTADARRRAELPDIAVSAEQQGNSAGAALSADDSVLRATGALSQARLDLDRTTLRSPVNGWVSNLLLQSGSFANTGRAAMTLIDADSFWVEGYFEETQLPRIRDGLEARVVLMAYPRRPVRGHVAGIGRGIGVNDAQPGVQGLPSVNPIFTWVRLAQRIPIRIALDEVPCGVVLSSGMTATVSILAHPPAADIRPRQDCAATATTVPN
ncbi:HlyD family secretion protein [Rhizosaccharibacter radicis]|uniref:HlyD family secretion protein n=1 Tax=Rhizosaccharibacter radicis TaxID=2782605 RepID=A0ABT1VUZ8_9PROT|nr:HlyD family secretion protein [Acetobacteraceae bacterium KSS12]